MRHAALRILLEVPRREGIWLSWITGRVSQALVGLEEDGLEGLQYGCADVPLHRRVELLEMRYDPCPVPPDAEMNCFAPELRLRWRRATASAGSFSRSTIHLPRTRDGRPGDHPYTVYLPRAPDFDDWKLLIGKKHLEVEPLF